MSNRLGWHGRRVTHVSSGRQGTLQEGTQILGSLTLTVVIDGGGTDEIVLSASGSDSGATGWMWTHVYRDGYSVEIPIGDHWTFVQPESTSCTSAGGGSDMTNDKQNNTIPTESGWWYQESITTPDSLVYVLYRGFKGLQYCVAGIRGWNDVTDDGLWRGPVPMPGEWAPRELADCLYYEALGVDNNDSELLRRYEEFIGDEE